MDEFKGIASADMGRWLRLHKQAIELGVNVGQIDRDKAQRMRLELTRRGVRY